MHQIAIAVYKLDLFPRLNSPFSMATFVIGGIMALTGLLIVRPEKKSVIENAQFVGFF